MEDSWGPEIKDLIVNGSKDYALKNYDGASEKFSEACEKYSETHEGEDNPTLLFLYGRAMFQIGVTKSDVLGGNGENKKQEPEASGSGSASSSKEEPKEEDPNFQLADDVAEEDEEEGEAEEEQSEFEIAWEALDAARALFKLEIEKTGSDEKETITGLETKLAETYDLLGEVSLESENFPQAALDLSESLELKKKLYDSSSSLISEAHFKLSLAYEFCVEDPDSKDKAIKEMVAAIASVQERLKTSSTEDATLIKDLETRLTDLKKSKYDDSIEKEKGDALLGLIGQDSDMKAQLVAALGNQANDISGLVKKKKPAASDKGKRKADEAEEPVKKAKTAEE